jgi:hypothetical protein
LRISFEYYYSISEMHAETRYKMKRHIFIIFLSTTLTAFGQSIKDGLVLYLPFTGNVADSSGNSYTIANNGATLAPDRFGNENSAYYFDGNDYMTISSAQNMPNIHSAGYTVSFWVKQNVSAADGGYMLSYGFWNGLGGFSFQYKAGTELSENYSAAVHKQSGSTSIFFNRYNIFAKGWNMVTLTYLNGTMKGYINGGFVEEKTAELYSKTGTDFVIGNNHNYSDGVTAWIDEILIYNRALSDTEVAEISGLSGAIRAAGLNAHTLADFELGELEPVKLGSGWGIAGAQGGAYPDGLSYLKVMENPLKSGANTSDYVGAVVTFPTCVRDLFNSPSRKYEYIIYTDDGDMNDRHHIMQWKALFPDSSIVKADSIRWLTQNQIHGDFQMFAPPCYGMGQIAGGTGGIFNENSIKVSSFTENPEDRLNFRFFYRAMPDSQNVFYTMDIGKWVTFTYDIFWTKSDTGYWRLYKDGELISSRDNVKTLPDCAPDVDGLRWKTGTYARWNDYVDNKIDSLTFYFDDLELYVGPEDDGISVYDICPKCNLNPCDTTKLVIKDTIQHATAGLENGKIELSVTGGSKPYTYYWNTGEGTEALYNLLPGSYFVDVTDNNGCSKRAGFIVNAGSMSNGYIFPTPVKNILNIKGDSLPTRVTIYTFDGRKVKSIEASKEIDVSNLNNGIYLATIKFKGTIITEKFVKI